MAENNESGWRTRVRSINKDLSIRGGFRSAVSTSRQGQRMISGGVQAISDATKQALAPARIERFDQALTRLGVNTQMLPIIHNQIIVQMYLSFFIGVAGLASMVNLFIRGEIFAGIMSLLISVAGLARAVQSSIQCYFIRHKEFGISNRWLHSPGDWFPSRLDGVIKLDKRDPLRDPKVVNRLAGRAQTQFLIGVVLMVVFLAQQLMLQSFSAVGWSLITLLLAMVLFMLGAKASFEVYKRREGVLCDMYPWMTTPRAWIPRMSPASALAPSKAQKSD